MSDHNDNPEFAALADQDEGLSDSERAEIKSGAFMQGELPEKFSKDEGPISKEAAAKAAAKGDTDSVDLRSLLKDMTIPQKMKFAMFGNSVCRGLLIKDSNRLIQLSVLKNPKLQLSEVEEFARNPNLSDTVFRVIAGKKEWMKSYQLKYALVTNPKTPGDLSLKWMRFLNAPELKKISMSRNVPQLVSVTAKKRLSEIEK